MPTWKYAPTHVFVHAGNRGFLRLPVARYIAHPPGTHPAGSPLVADCWALEMQTAHGSSWQGFTNAPRINSELRMCIDLTGRERDEVLAKLPDCEVM